MTLPSTPEQAWAAFWRNLRKMMDEAIAEGRFIPRTYDMDSSERWENKR